MPLIIQVLGSEVMVSIAGYQSASVDLADLAGHPQLNILGWVPQTWSLYNDHRVFVAPTRYAAGISYKVHEAASFGLPIVSTSLIASQIQWTGGAELLTAHETEPHAFARQVIALYQDEALWLSVRQCAAQRLMRDNNQSDYRRSLGIILAGAATPETVLTTSSNAAPRHPAGTELKSLQSA